MFSQTGGTWNTGVEAALPADADPTIYQSVDLDSVSCPSAGNCSVVGGYNLSSGEGAGLLLTETAGSWATGTQVALPANGSSGPTFLAINSISCASAGNCSGAGWYGLTTAGGGNQGLLFSTTTTAPEETLTVSDAGIGSGTVTSSPSGINCGATCTFKFAIGTEVTLTGTPGPHSYLTGWSAPTCGIGPCQIAMAGDIAVTATFDLNSYLVTVQKSGVGSGTVVSTTPDTELNCGATCAIAWRWGAQVTLIETPNNGAVFTGWSGGGCTGTQNGCEFTVGADTTVTATFARAPCVVPKVKGKSLSSARSAILDHYCKVGKVTKKASRKVRKRHVISQSPAPGKHLNQGTKINLVVSRGKHA
jgi:hypothetical protein